MKKAMQYGLAAGVATLLAGCGVFGGGDRIDYGSQAGQVAALEVPPDLTAPETGGRYEVSGSVGVATYSGYNRGQNSTAVDAQGHAAVGVLPQVAGVKLVRNGTQRWLAVEAEPGAVWSVLQAFVAEQGLKIAKQDAAVGTLETEWAEFREEMPAGGIRGVLGKVFSNAYSTGEKERFTFRLERAAQGTEVYVSYAGMEEVSNNQEEFKWQPRPANPQREAVMLQKLLLKLGGHQEAPVAHEAGAGGSPASLQTLPNGGKAIVLALPFDRAWHQTGQALLGAGLQVTDKDRARGVYFVRQAAEQGGWLDSLAFWKDAPEAVNYEVSVQDGGAQCQVTAQAAGGGSGSALLESLFSHFK